MNVETIISFLKKRNVFFELNVDLKKKTWIQRGGLAKVFIEPNSENQMIEVVQELYLHRIDFLVIGYSSNIYIKNTTNFDVVVSTKKCSSYILANDIIQCEAGVNVMKFANEMILQGVTGFEYLTGLPGTIAGALCNNSSCKENSISALLISAKVVMNDGKVVTMYYDDFKFAFRTSVFKEKKIKGTIVSAKLKRSSGNIQEMRSIARLNSEDRKIKLEGYSKNLGCTVNQTFINGRMPLVLLLSAKIYGGILRLCKIDGLTCKLRIRNFICFMSGYKHLAKYISIKNPIVFLWIDDKADLYFDDYLKFMNKVYRTNHLEIEVY